MYRDFQKQKLYSFEQRYISPFDTQSITKNEAQDWVNFIWYNEGRTHPPVITVNRQLKRVAAKANRNVVILSGDTTKRWIMVHEVVHSLQQEMTNNGDPYFPFAAHGAEFVYKYIMMLEKYMNIPMLMLLAKCKESKLKVKGLIA